MNNTFDGLNVSSKFGICGLPIRLDTYKTCSFGCKYCFSNGREVMGVESFSIADAQLIERRLERIKNYGASPRSLLDNLIEMGITWHCGGMSDPFQPANAIYKATNKVIDITARYGVKILFSTKSATIHGANINPKLHTFQMSVSNVSDIKNIEPNVPDIQERYKFYRHLKDNGFKVGIRMQPFIPDVSGEDIVEMFHDADHFTIEGLKIIPQKGAQKDWCVEHLGQDLNAYTQKGLLTLVPDYRLKIYQPVIDQLEKMGASYSIADNDLRFLGNNKCCCGDALCNSTGFDTTAMIRKYGVHWRLGDLLKEIPDGVQGSVAKHLFASNRQYGCITVKDFCEKRIRERTSPMSPSYQYTQKQLDINF